MTDKKEKLNINVPVAIMDGVRELQTELGLNKTSVVILALKNYIDQQKMIKTADKYKDLNSLKEIIEAYSSDSVRKL